MEFKKIFIVGAGTMGHGIAQVFAQGGYQVSMFSRTQETLNRADTLIRSSLDTQIEAGMVKKSQIKDIMSRITPTTSLESGAKDADLAIETVVETKEAKTEIFKQLDKVCPPKTIIASNSTSLNVFEFADVRPDKIMMNHWYTPPQIIPLVDVVKGPQTSQDAIDSVVKMLKNMGKKPVVFKKPLPGYVVSRFQIALGREMYYLLDNDFLTPEELDEATIWGLAMRMVIIGVVQRNDFGGLDLSTKTAGKYGSLAPADYKPRKLFDLVAQGATGVKAGRGFYDYKGKSEAELCHERDVRLLKLLKFLQDNNLPGPIH